MKIGASLYGGPILSDVESRRQMFGETDVFARRHLPNLVAGGLDLVFLPAASLREAAIFYKELRASDGGYALVKSSSEARDVIKGGKFACVLAASYSTIGSDTSLLEMLHELGVRLFTMSGNRRNVYVDGCGERDASGLSYSGIDLVGGLEDLRIIVDVSHASDRGVKDILDSTSRAMVVASHSNSRAVCDNPRNLTDGQIRAIADRGGMVGLSMHPTMVSWDRPDVGDVVDHIDHIVDLVGPDRVGIGTDYVDYIEDTFKHRIKALDPSGEIYGKKLHPYPEGLETVAKVGNLFKALRERGMDEATIDKIRGENVMGIF